MPIGKLSTALCWLAATLLGVFGVAAFLAPSWAVGEFPWSVGPLLAQTIGGWAIGTALMAAHVAWVHDARRTFPLIVYLGAFGVMQLLVVLGFLDRLQTGHLLTIPYVGGLAALVAATLAAAPTLARLQQLRGLRGPIPSWGRALAVLVGGFVLFLAFGTLVAGADGATARGDVFPEQMGLFSIRAFSAFLFSIGLAIASVLLARSAVPYLHLDAAGLDLVVPITLAALLNLGAFDFTGRPGGLVYLLAYVIVGLVLAAVLVYDRRNPAAFRAEI